MKKFLIFIILAILALTVGIGARYWLSRSSKETITPHEERRPPTEEEIREFFSRSEEEDYPRIPDKDIEEFFERNEEKYEPLSDEEIEDFFHPDTSQ
jgi:hypothetical protein